MVKIPELKDKQLIAQIYKYDKILKSLLKERKRRIATGKKPESLMTPKERQVAKKMKEKGMIQDDIQIDDQEEVIEEPAQSSADDSGDSDGLDGLNIDTEIIKGQEAAQDDEDEAEVEEEVRVTQLLQLSQDQIQEFKEKSKAAAAKKKKKKKKGLFGL